MNNKAIKQRVDETLKSNYMPYAVMVIVSRALPSVFDGLKPSHRKSLYMAHKMNISADNKTKSANLVGQTMKLNPHGDSAIYETVVRLTDCNESLLVPLFAGKGNFGKTYSRDMSFAASRYTEIGLADISKEFFELIDKNTVEFEPNYDGKIQEPKVLPVTFPNILVNPNQGIAVGMASNICSFNLEEVCKATIGLLQGDENALDAIIAPDFPTGGEYLYNANELGKIIKTGKGSIKIRARYNYIKQDNCIEIYEIPYTTKIEPIIDKIEELIKDGKIKEISDMRDETDLTGLKLTIDLKRGVNPEALMQKLFKLTTLEDTFSCNFNVLVKDKVLGNIPKVLGVEEILEKWIEWRMECLVNEKQFDLTKIEKEHHLLKGLNKVVLDVDKAIDVIRNSDDDETIITDLMNYFDIDRVQAEYIANIRLKNLNKKNILNKTAKMESLEEEIADLKDIISNQSRQKEILVEQLNGIIKKYGAPRKTVINSEIIETTAKEVLIDNYGCSFVLTEQGYFKKNLRFSETQKVKDGDCVAQNETGENMNDILLFSNTGNVYKMKAYEMDECTPSTMGTYLPPVLGLEDGERIIYMANTTDYKGHMLFAYEDGKISKITMKSYETKTNRKQLANAYSIGSPLVRAIQLDKDIDIACVSSIDKVLIVNTDQIPEKSTKNSQGVVVLKSKKSSYMKSVHLIPEVFPELTEEDLNYYRANRNAVGTFLKKEHDWKQEQLSL